MQISKDSDIFQRLVEVSQLEIAFKEAVDKLTSNDAMSIEEKAHQREVIEKFIQRLFQDVEDKLSPLMQTLQELKNLRNANGMNDETRVQAFECIMDEFVKRTR